MSRNLKRLIVILIISLTCAFATDRWYKSVTAFNLDYGDQKPIAELTEVINEAQRKPLKRLVWRSLSANDTLFSGEMVRTTELSQAKIVFPDTGTTINLEPDSMILIGDEGGHLTLEFMRGFLQVKGGKHEGLKLKSGNNQIGIAGSELSLGRGDSGGIQLQVFKGEPKIEGADFQQVKDSFQILKPTPNGTIHVLPTGKDFVPFEWKALEKEHEYVLEVGKSRKEMTKVDLVQSDATHAKAALAPGDYYWRLVAKPKGSAEDKDTLVSSVYRLRILPKRPPIAVAPGPEKQISVKDPEPKVTLRWANPGQLEDIVIELATSQDLKTGHQILKTEGVDFLEVQLKNNQNYYWRLTGYIPDSKEAVSGKVFSFNLKAPAEFTPPALLSPLAAANVSQTEMSANGVSFAWAVTPGAQNYQVILRPVGGKGEARTEPANPSPLSQVTIRNLPPGEYEWTVKSFDQNQVALPETPARKFKVLALAQVAWADGGADATWIYGGDTPELFTAWKAGPADTKIYRFSWREALGDSEPQVQELMTTEVKTNVPRDGRYIASIEAVNDKGQVVAKSNERAITVKASPPLSAPKLAGELPDPLKAERSGKIRLNWTTVEGAQNYVLEIKSPKGELVREEKATDPTALLKKLLPGDYTVNVRALDKFGRRGLASTVRPLVVPPVSDVSAPTMKKIKVE